MQAKRYLIAFLCTLLLISEGCSPAAAPAGVQGSTPTAELIPTSDLPASLPAPATKNSAGALENVAGMIYDTVAAGQNLNSYVIGIMTAFGVPPLGEADLALIEERYSQGLPIMFLPQAAEIADAYEDGGYLSLDAFIAAANDQGATQEGSDEPLTREYLTQKFQEYAGKDTYEPGEVLPAFVLALGQQRAAHFPPETPDRVWGDDLLDPIQVTLLLYSISYSSAGPLSARARMAAEPSAQDVPVSLNRLPLPAPAMQGGARDEIVDWITDQIADEVTGEVQDMVEIPLDKLDAAQASLCASLLLYGHKLKVTNTPNLIYHKDGEKPSITRVDVTLTFQDDYWNNHVRIDGWLLESFGVCKLPRRGKVPGKPLEWSVSKGLEGHGDFTITMPKTDDNGAAFAGWQAVPETTPKPLRTFHNQRDAVGAIIVRAGSLVPGWSGLERIIGILKDTGNTGDAPLTVIYYVGQAYEAVGQGGVQSYVGVICNLEKPFTLTANLSAYNMVIEFTPSSAEGGSFAINGTIDTGNSTTTVEGSGPYTVTTVDGRATQLVLTVEDAASFNPLVGQGQGDAFQMFIDLAPLATRECDTQ